MDSASEDLYMQQIEELVSDEDKILTVASAASIFNQNIQSVKNLFEKFVKDHKGKVSITYILSGTLKETKKKAVTLVKDTDLEQKKDVFKAGYDCVIYSIQKGKNVDFNLISMANKDLMKSDGKPLLGFVVSKSCTQRTLKTKKLPPPPAPTIKGKSSFFMKNPVKSEEKKEIKTEEKVEKKSTPQKTDNKSSKQGDIANMFSKMPPKKDKENVNGNQVNSTKDEEKEEKKPDDDFAMDVDTDVEETEEKHSEKVKEKSPQKRKVEKQDNKKSKKRQRKEKSTDPPNKRRKRIMQRDDSDSDDMFENADDTTEDIIEKSDEEPEPISKSILPPKNKIKRAIEKTYEDEEGFIVTKTEYIMESASEDEVEEIKKSPPKVEEKPKPTKEKKNSSNSENEVSPQKRVKGKKGKVENKNQPSIMSFFKKK